MEFSTNVYLSSGDQRYQLIYTSQVYGTFFGIYAYFNINETTLDSIRFKLINYKGIINIGIEDITHQINESNKTIEFNITIKGVSEHQDFPHLSNNSSAGSGGYSINVPLANIRNYYLEINRKIIPLGAPGKDTVNNVFDSEFYYRDGDRKPYQFRTDGNFLRYASGEELETKTAVIPKGTDSICPRGLAKIIHNE